MIEYIIKTPDSEEILELAHITHEARQASTLFDSTRTLESVMESVTRVCEDEDSTVVLAVNDGQIIGWTHIYAGFPTMMFIGRWYPVVRVGVESGPVALRLIEKSKEVLATKEHTRIEIELSGITETTEPDMKVYVGWYSECGFRLAAREVAMKANVVKVDSILPPSGYSLQNVAGVTNAEIEAPFFASFDDGQDDLYLSLNRAQQAVTFRHFFDRRKPMIDAASLVLFWRNQVVGFIVVREQNGVGYIGPVGILPEHRGKGLSKVLLTHSLEALYEEGISSAALDASINNLRARNLYEKYGFSVQHLKAFLFWSK